MCMCNLAGHDWAHCTCSCHGYTAEEQRTRRVAHLNSYEAMPVVIRELTTRIQDLTGIEYLGFITGTSVNVGYGSLVELTEKIEELVTIRDRYFKKET